MKRHSFFALFIAVIFSLNISGQNTITTNTLTQTSFCAGGNIVVQYSSTGTFPFGCTFNAELSDASGNFTNPVVVGSVPINTGIIAGTIPSNTPFGFNYRVRVVASDPYTVGSVSTTSIIITNTVITATVIANPDTEICHGDTITLWVNFNASYFWSTGETTQSIHITESGAYTVSVKNYITGCEVTSDSIIITVHQTPLVNFGPDFGICEGHNFTLNAGSGFSSYLWNDSTITQYMYVDSSGTYSVVVIDSFGCTGGDTVKSTLHQNPVVDIGTDTTLCGNQLLLSAGTGFIYYNWNNGLSFNNSYLADTSGMYFISIVDSNGCSDRDTILVNILPLPTINLGNDISACGNSILLNAGEGYSGYNWNNGLNSNQFFHVSTTGTYFVKVTDQSGCFISDTINVTIHTLPDINLGSDILLSINDSLVLDAGSGYLSYQWSSGQNSESIVIDGWSYPLGPLNIGVTVTDNNGCINTDEIVITIVPADGINGFFVFPNPFHDVINIVSNNNLYNLKPVFYDMLGKYYYPEFYINNTGMLINRGDISNGCYMLFFYDKKELQVVGKFIMY